MGSRDAKVDAYIAKSQPFAQAILSHIREVVHVACPDTVEAMKWSMPFFTYKGALLCNMAAFKAHASFGFWLGSQVLGDDAADGGMGQFGKLSSIKDLPTKSALAKYVKKAMALVDAGVKLERAASPVKKVAAKKAAVMVPPELDVPTPVKPGGISAPVGMVIG
jgi:hypothetical protein